MVSVASTKINNNKDMVVPQALLISNIISLKELVLLVRKSYSILLLLSKITCYLTENYKARKLPFSKF